MKLKICPIDREYRSALECEWKLLKASLTAPVESFWPVHTGIEADYRLGGTLRNLRAEVRLVS